MTQTLLIAIAAGAAAALLFSSVASGSVLSVPLFYLAPLPVMIAALGWSHLAGLLAAMIGAVAIGATFHGVFALAFLLGVGLPAWWLGYLALLARPTTDPNGAAAVDWYPVGRLVAWACLLGALVVSVAIVTLAGDAETLRAALGKSFEEFLRGSPNAPGAAPAERSDRIVLRALLENPEMVLPAAAAILAALTLSFSLWLAGRVVRVSGRLGRPWPDISALALPPQLLLVLVAAVVAAFFPGLLGIIGTIFTATTLVAFGLLGLAVVHDRTASLRGRGGILTALYASIFVFGWPFAIVAVVGIVDTLFPLRNRPDRGGPPALTT